MTDESKPIPPLSPYQVFIACIIGSVGCAFFAAELGPNRFLLGLSAYVLGQCAIVLPIVMAIRESKR